MNWPLIKHDLRKALPPHLIILVALVGSLLATNRILDAGNKFALAFGLAQGWLLAWCIFRDPNNTDAFVFSRPYTRQQVFWSRWMLAMVLQAISIGAIYAILAVGARTWIHGNHLPHYPMVAPFELVVVRTIAFASLITFHLVMFLTVRSRALSTGTGQRWKAYVVKLACLMILMVFIGGIPVAATDGPWRAPSLAHCAAAYALVLAAMTTAASLNAYKNMEVGK